MRNIKLSIGMLAFSAFLTFSACQKDEAVVPAMTEETSSAFQLEDLAGLESPEVTVATETAGFRIQETDRKTDAVQPLGAILKKLNLDEAQRTAIKGYMEQHNACVAEHRSKIKERHQNLVERANAVREEHIEAYRAGRITKEELKEKLTALRARLKENLNKDDQKQLRMRMMRKCRAELMTSIKSVLTREQQQKFNRWLQSQQ